MGKQHLATRGWGDIVDEPIRKFEKILEFVLEGEEMFDKVKLLWTMQVGGTFAAGTDQAVANQVFGTEGVNGGPRVPVTATAGQVAMVADLRLALDNCHAIYQAMDAAKLRKFT